MMPVPFPKLHIAESVLNRIYNAMEDLETMPSLMPSPIPPADPLALGQQIEEETQNPAPEVELPPTSPEAEIAEESLMGGSAFNGALVGMLNQ